MPCIPTRVKKSQSTFFYSICIAFSLPKEVNVAGSSRVTDDGIFNLFGRNLTELNPCSKTIKFMKMRSTGVRVNGVKHLLASAKKLQGVRGSTYDLLQVIGKWHNGGEPNRIYRSFGSGSVGSSNTEPNLSDDTNITLILWVQSCTSNRKAWFC